MIGAKPGERSSTIKNPLKAVKVDKFTSGMKGKLLEQEKQEKEKRERMLEDQRQRDAMDIKAKLGDDSVKNVITA